MSAASWSLRLFASLLLFGSVSASAAAPALMETLKGEKPIQLRGLHIAATVRGGLAETTVRMVFFNPNGRPLEGNLQFPLLDGQEIAGFALDIDGSLRAAVPVDKAKGRRVFEDIERQRIDPALLEKTQGNNFRLRVFPIPASGTRTVEIKVAESLARTGDDWSYRLPLAYADGVADFELLLDVDGGAGKPRANQVLGQIEFERSHGRYRADVARRQFTPTGDLQLLLPATQRSQNFVQVRDGDTFFIAELPLSGARTPRRLPKVVGLLWDSSGSGAARALDAELAVLDRYFVAIGNGEVRLTRLRDRSEPSRRFSIVEGDWSALRKELQATVYDGASALADWQPQADVGEYLLVSDGLINYGPLSFPKLAPGRRLYALNSAASADSSRLRAIAESTGGRLVQVTARSPGAAADALLSEGTHVDSLAGVGVTDLHVEAVDPVNALVRVAGRLLAPQASVTLQLSANGKTSQAITVPIHADAPDHPLAARLWASYRLAALDANPELQRAEIRRLGQRFGMATKETSLIVLDRVEDYVTHDIDPPAELRTRFEELQLIARRTREQNGDEHLEQVARAFAEKIAWWETPFPKDAPAAKEQIALAPRAANGAVPMAGLASAPAPASAMPPPPPEEPAVVYDTPSPVAAELDTIAVTGSRIQSQSVVAGDGSPSASGPPRIGIALKRWQADAPYIARMKAARPEDLYAIYLDEKPSYSRSSGFFLDVADLLLERNQRELALRVLSNLAEMDLEDRHILRILGYRLLQAGAPELAIPVLEKVRWLAEEEPQSFRDLGLALAAAGHDQQAIEQLFEVVRRPWDNRFAEIELIALAELNAIIANSNAVLDTQAFDARLLKNLPLDLRVVLTWDADNSDMDLWVTDPNGEKCFYSHKLTYQGGRMSDDFTGGYGPEEFSLRVAKPGKYKVETNYFGDSQQSIAGATTLQVRLTTGFGSKQARDQWVTLRLKNAKETVFVGEFTVE
jgi:hypothetical protein